MRTLADRRLSRRVLVGELPLPGGIVGHWVSLDVSGSSVALWPDRSGFGLDMTQSSSDMRPALTPNGIGSRQVVTFDGSNDYLLGPSLPPAQSSLSVVGVVRHHNVDTAQRAFFGGNDSGRAGPAIYTEGGVWRMFAGDSLVSSIPVTSDWVVASGVWSSGTGVLRVGTETAIGAVGTRPIIVPRIGAYGNNNTNFVGPWDGDIAEIVFWMRALSSVELEEAHSALASKYGLAS